MKALDMAEATQFLTFKLGDEVFAFGISRVREVLDYTTVTRIPQMPDFMLGVINLRGSVVSVVDLRLKFGIEPSKKGVNTCIVIVEVDLEGETTILGALADSVQEVLNLDPEYMEPAPRIGTRVNSKFIKAMGRRGDDFIILLDIDKVFCSEELAMTLSSTHGLAAAS